jgi:hypothetical protein
VELEDLKDLIYLRVTTEKWLFFDELSENTPNSPNINAQTVLFLTEQNLWGSVPQSLDFVSQSLDWDSKGPCKSKICNFEIS